MATNDTNGVIYLEADEDITSAIDKLTKSSSDKIQIVSAKRSSILQSVINLRLLKKAAKDAGKELALVTSDRVATNLAGRVGLPVATQVGETAEVPKATAPAATTDDEIDGGTVGGDEPKINTSSVVPVVSSADADEPKNPVETSPAEAAPKPIPVPSSESKTKPQKSKVPNIGVMQKRLLWVGAAVAAIILLFGLNYYLTSAKVTLYAKASQVNAQFDFTADPNASTSDTKNGTLAAQQLTLTKTLNASVQATGTKDLGAKASGTMTIINNDAASAHDFVAGTRFQAPDGKIFRLNADAHVEAARAVQSGHGFSTQPGQTTAAVTADQNGDSYNEGPGQYSIPGLSGDQQQYTYGKGGQMQGGVSKVAKVVTADDVNKAQQSALDADKSDATSAIKKKANSQQSVLEASIQQNVTSADSSPKVGEEAQTANLAVQVSYTALAVSKIDLSSLAKSEESAQLGGQSQIYDDGSGSLQLTAKGKPSDGAMDFSAKATAYYGNKIDTTALAKQIKGKKYGDAMGTAGQVQGVEKAEITITPGWATGMPHITKHIHTTIKVSGVGSD